MFTSYSEDTGLTSLFNFEKPCFSRNCSLKIAHELIYNFKTYWEVSQEYSLWYLMQNFEKTTEEF